MKNLYTIVLFVSMLFIAFSTHAQKVELISGETAFSITDNDYQKLSFKNTLTQFNGFVVKHNSGFYNQLLSDSYGSSLEVGKPQLPVLKKIIEIPLGSEFVIQVSKENYQEFDLLELGIENPIFPTQAPVSKSTDNPEDIPFEKNEPIYQTDTWYGFETVQVKTLGTMRGVNLARLEISPIEYNPVKHTIRVCTDLEVKISFTGGNKAQTINQKKNLFSPYFEGVYKQIANYKTELTDELIMDDPVTYIIVSDPMFETTLQPFIEWKTKKGFNVVEAYTNDPGVGTTTTSIKSYLEGFYNSPPTGYNAQSFVLFVGDIGQIPAYDGTSGSHVSDLYYCDYTGDIYPECYYGRFSAESIAELQPQIDKTLEYEQYLMPDPSFLDEVVMVTGDDSSHEMTWGNGQINYGTTYYFNLAHGITSHTYLQDEPTGANYSGQIRQNVSDGVAYGNYSAHCSSSGWANPSFVNSHIDALTNAHKYPLLVGNCCLSNKFDDNDCFGENLLKAVDKGALGYIGGSNSTYWDEDFWWGVGYETVSANPVYHSTNLGSYDRTWHDQGEPIDEWYLTQGQMPSAGNLAVTQAGSSLETYYWEIYHLMGDPSLMIYFTQPPITTASYNALMPVGTTSFTVSTEPYAYVAISKDGTLHGAAVANGSGVADLTLDPINVPGNADVVVTRQNGQPFIGTVTVASPSGPYLSLESFNIDDATGNNNNQADYNETVLLDVTLENLGSSTATNVSATITSTDSYVVIQNNSSTWPNIANGTLSTQNGAFELTFSNDIPDQHMAEFELNITDGSETWSAQLNITVNAPLLEAGSFTVADVAGGNGNGRLDAGETANIIIQTLNNGESVSPVATTILTSVSPWITINSGNFNIGSIAAGSSEPATFNISCDINTPIGTSVDFNFDLTAGNYGFNYIYYESIGLVLEDWETGDFTNFPWINGGNTNWTVQTSDVYEGSYSAKSGLIDHNEESTLTLTVATTVDDNISFYRKVSSESNYDYLQFWIDDVLIEEWAGEADWEQVSYPVTAGAHIFKWSYDKDGSVSTGSDCGWIDYIILPPLAPVEPNIVVNPLLLDFEEVIIGQTGILPFTIENTGADNLSGSIITPAFYTVGQSTKNYKDDSKNTINFVIPPTTSETFEVMFDPTNTNCISDNIYINSNDPDQPSINLAVTGCGIYGANLVYNPFEFNKVLGADMLSNEPLVLENTGDFELDYSAQVIYSAKSKDVATIYPSASAYSTGSCTASAKTENSLAKAFPPDEDGWMKFDISSIPDGATINSIEFHGYVNNTNYPWWSMTPVTVDPVTADAATLYADMTAEASSSSESYLYQSETSEYTTGWKTHTLPVAAFADMEAALAQDWFTVGIVSRDGSSDYYIYFDGWNETNTPYLVVDYTYNPPYTWLTVDNLDQVNGTISIGDKNTIDVGFSTNSLELGMTYYADIMISSNDPDMQMATIPVELTVASEFKFEFNAFLQGAYSGTEMTTELNIDNVLPLNQPFNIAPWNYTGTESVTTIPSVDIVDWVLIELRSAPSVELATSSTIITQQAGFILKDGSVVGFDRIAENDISIYDLSTLYGLYAVIWHRNHLGIISAYHPTNTDGKFVYDFTSDVNSGNAGADGQTNLGNGVYGMISGDGNCDGDITEADLLLWKPEAGKNAPGNLDYNLDCEVNNIDKDEYLIPNMGSGCQVPD